MSGTILTLWDLLKPARPRPPKKIRPRPGSHLPQPPKSTIDAPVPRNGAARTPMRGRYEALVEEMKRTHNIRVRKWRSSSTGCAWEVHYADGTVSRLIESPYPRGPMSCAIFLHEVGHHAIGLARYKPRCLEEYHAWAWSLSEMRQRGFNVTPPVEKRMAESLHYAIAKARRRGLKRLPAELLPYVTLNGRDR